MSTFTRGLWDLGAVLGQGRLVETPGLGFPWRRMAGIGSSGELSNHMHRDLLRTIGAREKEPKTKGMRPRSLKWVSTCLPKMGTKKNL